jgi:CheY-like chemotaxis protein
VRDGQQALDFLFCRGAYSTRAASAPKLVLLDVNLPKVDGLEVLRAIRGGEHTSTIPVVMFSSSKEQKDVVRSYRLHVNSFIQKPVELEAFQKVIEALAHYWMVVNEPPPAEGL